MLFIVIHVLLLLSLVDRGVNDGLCGTDVHIIENMDVLLIFRVYKIIKSLMSLFLLLVPLSIPSVDLPLLFCINMLTLVMEKLSIYLDSLKISTVISMISL